MKSITITFRSVTYASKAKRLLSEIRIAAKLVKADQTKSENGCLYGLEIKYSDFLSAVKQLKDHDIYYSIQKT